MSGVPELLPLLGDETSAGFISLALTGDLEDDLVSLTFTPSAILLHAATLSTFSSVFFSSLLFDSDLVLSPCSSNETSLSLTSPPISSVAALVLFSINSCSTSSFCVWELIFTSFDVIEFASLDVTCFKALILGLSSAFSFNSFSGVSSDTVSLDSDTGSTDLVLTLFRPIIDFIDCVPKSTLAALGLFSEECSLATELSLTFSTVLIPLSLFCPELLTKVDKTLALVLTFLGLTDFPPSNLVSSLGGMISLPITTWIGLVFASLTSLAMGTFEAGNFFVCMTINCFLVGETFALSSLIPSFCFLSSFEGDFTAGTFFSFIFPELALLVDLAFLTSFALLILASFPLTAFTFPFPAPALLSSSLGFLYGMHLRQTFTTLTPGVKRCLIFSGAFSFL